VANLFFSFHIIYTYKMENISDKIVMFEKRHAYQMEKDKLYEPEGSHENFNVYANEVEKEKEQYSFINKEGYCVGSFISKLPNSAARKVLRRIYQFNGNPSPVFYIYNHNTHVLYRYAGLVEPIKKRKAEMNIAVVDGGNIRIKRQNNYIVRQIEKKQF
jgi:hypothetical protein